VSYFIRRLLAACVTILGALTVVFLILYWLPGDPAALIAGDDATPDTIEQLRIRLGTDKSFLDQYISYLVHLGHADIGISFSTGEPVLHRLTAQIPATLELTFTAFALAMALGVIFGLAAAVNRGKWLDHAIQTSLLFLLSMPSFWLGILLILIFSVFLKWLPAVGSGSFSQLILPVACLALVNTPKLARMVRNSVIDVLDEPFVMTLRGKGLKERQVLTHHVLRNALIPAATLLGILVGELISSAVVVETLFARQGIGRLLVEAVGVKDIPMMMGVTLFASTVYILINVLVDCSYSWIDPRIQS
jgi:ABC-type dipeptide/oligopeptide/nickel transport system permease component